MKDADIEKRNTLEHGSSPVSPGVPVPIDPERVEAHAIARVQMTVSCRDSDYIEKVSDAGKVYNDRGLLYQVMHNGIRVIAEAYNGVWTSQVIGLLKGHHEPQEEKVFHEVLKFIDPGSTMVELGSFWGYYSLWFQKAIPDARLHLIEPDPNNFLVGRYNFVLNSVRANFYQYAIGKQPVKSVAFHCESDSGLRAIEQISVDAFVERNNIEKIELLLSDIQGAELEMLEGAEKTIEAGKLRFVFVSTHHQIHSGDRYTHEKCLEFLQSRGAFIIASHDVFESYSGDGLIVASFDQRDKAIGEISISKNDPENSLFGRPDPN